MTDIRQPLWSRLDKQRQTIARLEEEAKLHRERHASLLVWLKANYPEVFKRAILESLEA